MRDLIDSDAGGGEPEAASKAVRRSGRDIVKPTVEESEEDEKLDGAVTRVRFREPVDDDSGDENYEPGSGSETDETEKLDSEEELESDGIQAPMIIDAGA